MFYSDARKLTATFDPASLAANTTIEESITVTGATTSDIVLKVIKPTHTAGYVVGGNSYVSAADTVKVSVGNPTGSASNPGSETWTFYLVKTSNSGNSL